MNLNFVNVYDCGEHGCKLLYELLAERTPEQNISHKAVPTWEQHLRFVASVPYPIWYLIADDYAQRVVGACYITLRREVGIFIFRANQGKGYGSAMLAKLRELHPGRLLANIAPGNERSIAFFTKHGARLIQQTFELA